MGTLFLMLCENNRVLESVDQEVLGSHLGSLFRMSFEISFKPVLAIASFVSWDFVFSVKVCLLCVSRAALIEEISPSPFRHLAVFLCSSLIYLFNELLNSSSRYLLLYELNKEGCLAARHGGNCSYLPLLRLRGTSGQFFSAARINLGLCLVGWFSRLLCFVLRGFFSSDLLPVSWLFLASVS